MTIDAEPQTLRPASQAGGDIEDAADHRIFKNSRSASLSSADSEMPN